MFYAAVQLTSVFWNLPSWLPPHEFFFNEDNKTIYDKVRLGDRDSYDYLCSIDDWSLDSFKPSEREQVNAPGIYTEL